MKSLCDFFREQSFYLFTSLLGFVVSRIHANYSNSRSPQRLARSRFSRDYLHSFFQDRRSARKQSKPVLIPSAERNERRRGTKRVGSRSNERLRHSCLDFRLIFRPFLIGTTKRSYWSIIDSPYLPRSAIPARTNLLFTFHLRAGWVLPLCETE